MNFLDRMIGFVNPRAGALRLQARHAMNVIAEKVRRYDAAGHGRRFKDMPVGTVSANRETEVSLMRLIARSRQLDQNNPYAKRAVERIADNVVGIGIRPTFGRSVVKLQKAWKAWGEGDSKECDFDGRMNIYGLQWLAMRTVAESGGCIVRKRRTAKNKSGIPIQLQILEPDILDLSKNYELTDGGFAMQGIEFDSTGRRRGYWLYDRYPSENYGIKSSLESKFGPASDVIHVYQVERPGQVHGVPFGVQAFMRLKDFDDYEDAELIRQKIAACYAVFVEESIDSPTATGGTTRKSELTERIEPGAIQKMAPGEKVSFTNPPAKEGIAEYSRQVLRGIAAAYGTTYESLTGDMSNVNFSSGRMGWLESQRMYNRYQFQMFIPTFCSESFAWFLEGAKIGLIYTKDDITADWTPPRREMIDPSKEIAAMSAAVRNGFQDWGEAVTELGYDPDTILDRMEKWAKEFDSRGLILDSDPRKTAVGGKIQAPPSEEEPENAATGSEDTPAQAAKKKAVK